MKNINLQKQQRTSSTVKVKQQVQLQLGLVMLQGNMTLQRHQSSCMKMDLIISVQLLHLPSELKESRCPSFKATSTTITSSRQTLFTWCRADIPREMPSPY